MDTEASLACLRPLGPRNPTKEIKEEFISSLLGRVKEHKFVGCWDQRWVSLFSCYYISAVLVFLLADLLCQLFTSHIRKSGHKLFLAVHLSVWATKRMLLFLILNFQGNDLTLLESCCLSQHLTVDRVIRYYCHNS